MSPADPSKTSAPAPDENGSVVARTLRALNRVYSRGFHRIDVQTPPQFPPTGAAILACNHISGLDPLLLQSAVRRPVVWMMAKEYYQISALRWVYEAVEAIPVERNGRDSTATRAALRALGNGRILGIFPEGRIEKTRDLIPFQTGLAMMAVRTEVPVIPAYLDGTNRGQNMVEAFITPNDIRLRFGPPIHLHHYVDGGKPDLDSLTERLSSAVASLKSAMT